MKSDFEKVMSIFKGIANPEDGLTFKETVQIYGQMFSVCSPKGRCFLIGGYALHMCLIAAVYSIYTLGLTDFLVPGMHVSASTSFLIALATAFINFPLLGLVKLKAINIYAPLFSMWLLSALFPAALSFESFGALLQSVVVMNLVIYIPGVIVLAGLSELTKIPIQVGFPMKKTPWIFTIRLTPQKKSAVGGDQGEHTS